VCHVAAVCRITLINEYDDGGDAYCHDVHISLPLELCRPLVINSLFSVIPRYLIIPPPTQSSGRRYSVFQQKFLSSFFSFAKGSLRWLYRRGTFIAQKVGYRCNFIKLVRNLGADPPAEPQTSQNSPNRVKSAQPTTLSSPCNVILPLWLQQGVISS